MRLSSGFLVEIGVFIEIFSVLDSERTASIEFPMLSLVWDHSAHITVQKGQYPFEIRILFCFSNGMFQ